ncbi:hypothetical protein R3P38DRAFT_3417640 [Favolaschia claudopus]|uniref:BZIP domain-containing protein n=1 Tax=Favolaschia claudopus TaxID=2862362 RepID=A0AAW0EFB5_9AGAR
MPKNTSDDPATRAQEIAIRKKKNADAQAAFRARRANYIATLEETVTSLESVVLQLQDSCREARSETHELRQQNASLRHDYHAREKFWRTLWQSRKCGENEELPPLPPQLVLNHNLGPSQLHGYDTDLAYRSHDDSTMCGSGQYHAETYNHPSSIPYPGNAPEQAPHLTLTQRGSKYGPYSYNVAGSHRDHTWSQNTSPSGESGPPPSASSSSSPSFGDSSSLASPSDLSVPFTSRSIEEAKVSVNSLDSTTYVFPASSSRSISPHSTPSSSTTSLTSPFQFTFPDPGVQHERPLDYRRCSNPRSEVSLSGPGSDAIRYRLGSRRGGPSGTLLPILPPLSMSDSGSPHERGSSDGDSYSFGSRVHPRRDSLISPPSRSSSPSAAPALSGTLAVIKAQAFGALRRSRTRTRKHSDMPAKTALDVLEARGIAGVSTGTKRQRTEESEEGETQQH